MEKKILIGLLTKTLNKSEQEVTDLLYQKGDNDELILKDGVEDELFSLDSARVENIKKNAPVPKERLDNEYKRGQKETMESYEKALKEKYSIDSEKKGVELVDEVLAKLKKTSKLSDDEVKKHPLYLELESNRIDKKIHEDLKKEYDEFKTGIEKSAKFAEVKDIAGTLLDEMKPIVSENPAVAKARRDDFLAKFEAFDYQKEGDKHIILKPDGSRMEDGHGNPMELKDFVKDRAVLYYDFPKQDGKGNSGSEGEGGKGTFTFTVPKNDEEYIAAIRSAKTTEEKVAIKEAYSQSKS